MSAQAAAGAAQSVLRHLSQHKIEDRRPGARQAGPVITQASTRKPGRRWLASFAPGMMPPAGAPRPDRHALDALAGTVEDALDRAAAANPNPGRTPLHRMNRGEYANAIRDLLAVDVDAATLLPADDSSNGFDNIADVLGVSPALLERYVCGGGQDQPAGGGRSRNRSAGRHLHGARGSEPNRNAGWPAAWNARRHGGPAQLSAGWRISDQAVAA